MSQEKDDAPQPRDDVYQVAALLAALRRVVQPLAPAATLSSAPQPEPMPALPSDRKGSR